MKDETTLEELMAIMASNVQKREIERVRNEKQEENNNDDH